MLLEEAAKLKAQADCLGDEKGGWIADIERQGDRLFAIRQLHDLVHQFHDKWHAEFFNASNDGKPQAA